MNQALAEEKVEAEEDNLIDEIIRLSDFTFDRFADARHHRGTFGRKYLGRFS